MKLLKRRVANILVSSLVVGQCVLSGASLYANDYTMPGHLAVTDAMIEKDIKLGVTTGPGLQLKKIGGYSIGAQSKEGGAAEIVQFNADNNKFYVINGMTKSLEIIGLEEVLDQRQDSQKIVVDIAGELEKEAGFIYGDITSVAINVRKNLVAVVVQHEEYSKSGRAVVLDYKGDILGVFEVGVQPDMVTFSPDGRYILTADEGEPRLGYGEDVEDPKGSITLIDIARGVESAVAETIDFTGWDNRRDELVAEGVLLKTGAKPSEDLEPEYITISADSTKAYIALQEANAIATLDIATRTIESIKGLGFKDHSIEENAIDMVKDGQIHITTAPALGVYMPDAIGSYESSGKTYIVTANEGDGRSYVQEDFPNILDQNQYSNEIEKRFKVDEDGQVVEASKNEGGQKVTLLDSKTIDGLEEGKNYILGGRSFSIWDAETMEQVYDSGSDFERIIAEVLPEHFNASNTNTELDNRSGKKGPEPEGVAIGMIGDRTYAFIVIERVGGVMVYDITNPYGAIYESYINTRDFGEAIAGDVSGEGVDFISAAKSPTGKPLVLVANEVSGTVSVYEAQVTSDLVEENVDITIFHTNDMHGRVVQDSSVIGIDTIAGIKDTYEQALLLDAGDTIHGLPFATLNKGEDIIQLMKLAGYDAMAPGNHEFNYGSKRLLELAAQAESGSNNFSIIASNISYKEDDSQYLEAHQIEVVNGIKIGIFGLATEETLYKTNPSNVEDINITSPIEAAKEQVAALKAKGVDIIIALSHVGTDTSSNPTSEDIAKEVPEIDVIIDGHSHTEYEAGYKVNGVLIASTGEYENNLGKVILTVNKKEKAIVVKEATLINHATALSDYEPNEWVQEEIEAIKEEQQPILDTVIGKTTVTLDGERANVRTGETNLGNLVTDAMRDLTNADIAITNGGGLRATIEVGEITKGDVISVLPFGNYIVTKKLTGAQIKGILEHGVKDYPATAGGFPHVSGISYEFDEAKEVGNRVHSIKMNGKALDLNQTYLVATNDFLSAGGDQYPYFGEVVTENEFISLEEALGTFIEKLGIVNYEKEGRILVSKASTIGGEDDDESDQESHSGSNQTKPEITPEIGEEGTEIVPVTFSDVKAGAWYDSAITRLAKEGILNGRGDGKFEPHAPITRAEVAKIISLVLELELTNESQSVVTDIKEDAWYASYMKTLVKYQILQGADGKVRPDDEVTREELAVIILRALPQLTTVEEGPFIDVQIGHWATPAIHTLAAAGIVQGKTENQFDGKAKVTRAECAVMMDRVLDFIK